jgi:hypothetical protein
MTKAMHFNEIAIPSISIKKNAQNLRKKLRNKMEIKKRRF